MSLAVLLMAHGTPESLDQMPAYLTRVRGGRPPSSELIEEMRYNYGAIGGRSPLTDLTLRQADALRARLGPSIRVMVGMRNWHPFIADALSSLAGSDVSEVLGIPLAPQYSSLSVQKYIDAAVQAMPAGIRFTCAPPYFDHPKLIEAFAEQLKRARSEFADADVIFTAHSLPLRVIEGGDPYAEQVQATAAGVAAAVGLARYDLAFQSAGRTPEPWVGPDLGDFIRQKATGGARRLLVAPIGFVCDHTEILFDIDVQARAVADTCGVALWRTESLNVAPAFIETLEALVVGRTQAGTEA